VSPTEPLKGPLLQDITKRYQKEELIESIVKPSAKIAQGFESQYFVTNDGKILEGFVVRESGEEIEFRNVAGLAAVLKKTEIEDRGKRATSIMPSGLVDKLNPGQLASILAYLESLKK
jgi:putative heme-binding domain-containing protein